MEEIDRHFHLVEQGQGSVTLVLYGMGDVESLSWH